MQHALPLTEQTIAARLERLPYSRWHVGITVILGVAIFFDSFDSLAIAYVLPVVIRDWSIAPEKVGALLSIANFGQAVGAFAFGWIAERVGRVPAVRITIALYAVMSFACAFAQSYDQLFWFRFVEGIGLGGEIPVASSYISEILRAQHPCSWAASPRDTPMAAAIAGCVIPLSRSNTICMRCQCAAGIFQRNAVFNCRIWALPYLTICPSESNGQSETRHAHRRQFPSVRYESHHKTLRFQSAMEAVSNRIRAALHTGLIDFSE
jgi:sugar phosphate permease